MEPTTDYRAVVSHEIIEVMKLFRLVLREVVTMSLLDGPRPVLFEFKTHQTTRLLSDPFNILIVGSR